MRSRLLAGLIIGLLAASFSSAQKASAEPSSSLLYKVEGKGLSKPSYLFGTIHVVCSADAPFLPKLESYVNSTEQLMLEIDLNDPKMTEKATALSFMKDGKTLKDLLTEAEYAKLDAIYKEYHGFSVEVLKTMKPMLVSTYLLSSSKIAGCPQPSSVDKSLAEAAKVQKRAIIPLESFEEQMAVMDSLPANDQVRSIKSITTGLDIQVKMFKDMIQLYAAQDSAKLYDLIKAGSTEYPTFSDSLLDTRNKKWIPLIENAMKAKPTFAAFGAGHLGGKNGVIQLLQAKGYTVTPIRL